MSAPPKTQPQAIDAEREILGTMMLSQDAAAIAISQIKPDHFYDRRHQLMMRGMSELFSRGENVDVVTLINWMSQQRAEVAPQTSYVAEMLDLIPIVSAVSGKCRIVKEKAKARGLIELAMATLDRCYHSDPVEEITEDFGTRFFKLTADESKASSSLGELLPGVISEVSEIQRSGHIQGITTGYSELDKRWNGLSPSKLIILAARPAMGKTSLAMNIAENAAVSGNKVMIFSLEMSKHDLAHRMLSGHGRVDSEAMRKGYVNEVQWKSLTHSAGTLSQLPVVIDDTSGISLTALTARAKVEHLKGQVGLIIVDYLQLMQCKGAGSREAEIAAISRGLKGLAKDLSVPVIALSQLNRKLEERNDRRPLMSDLRESGAIEQDADIVAFIYRDVVYNEKSPFPELAEIITRKQRGGPSGADKLRFEGQYSRFYEYSALDEM